MIQGGGEEGVRAGEEIKRGFLLYTFGGLYAKRIFFAIITLYMQCCAHARARVSNKPYGRRMVVGLRKRS